MGKKVVILGAVALGPKVACRLRRLDPDVEILMIDRDSSISYGGCGIPYYVGGDVTELKELQSTVFHVQRDASFFEIYKHLDVRTRCEATSIDRKAKTVSVTNLDNGDNETVSYDDLVIALGSTPFVPPLPGADLPGVHVVANLHHAQAIKEKIQKGQVSSAVVVGGGAIGLEMAESFTDLWGIETTVVEMFDSVLPQALSPDMAKVVHKEMEDNDIRLLTSERVEEILGDAENGVRAVRTAGAGEIPCELVIFCAGARPNSQIAREAGLAVGRFGGILVDERMRTSDPNIYAGGDCVEIKHLISGENYVLALGSMANRQGRVIGTNIAGGHAEFHGAVGSFCLKMFEQGVAKAGLTVRQAETAGFDPVYALIAGSDRAHFYPTQKPMYMKLIADRKTRRVLGVEAVGANGDAVKARVDAVAALMVRGCTVDEIGNLEVAYAPPYASAMDIVNAVGNTLENVLDGYNHPMGVEEFITDFQDGKFRVLDVRSEDNAAPYKAKYGDRWINIPQDQLDTRLDEIPRDEPLVCFCNTGLRSFECQRYLHTKGFDTMTNVQGGHGFLRLLAPDFTD